MEALVAGWLLRLGIGFGLGSDFQIIRTGPAIAIRGRISAASAREIRSFLRDDLPEASRFAVAGTFGRGRSFRLRWAGRVDGPTRQRLRNLLVEVLK